MGVIKCATTVTDSLLERLGLDQHEERDFMRYLAAVLLANVLKESSFVGSESPDGCWLQKHLAATKHEVLKRNTTRGYLIDSAASLYPLFLTQEELNSVAWRTVLLADNWVGDIQGILENAAGKGNGEGWQAADLVAQEALGKDFMVEDILNTISESLKPRAGELTGDFEETHLF